MAKKIKKRTLDEVFYDLAPYFRSLVPDDNSDDFLPVLTVMFPKSWVMLAIPTLLPEVKNVGPQALEYIFSIPQGVTLDDVVDSVLKSIEYNHEHEAKVAALEEEKKKLMLRLEDEMKALEEKMLPKKPKEVEAVSIPEETISVYHPEPSLVIDQNSKPDVEVLEEEPREERSELTHEEETHRVFADLQRQGKL
jgi:hypothetical protein